MTNEQIRICDNLLNGLKYQIEHNKSTAQIEATILEFFEKWAEDKETK